jgi:hypothetical protein
MFKNIFPDNLKRLVYMTPGPEKTPPTQAELEATYEADRAVTPAQLRAERDALKNSILKYAKDIEQDVAIYKTVKIDLKDPTSYESLDQGTWSVVQSLAEAMQELEKGALTRTNLDLVRIKVDAAAIFNRSIRMAGDPLMHSADLSVSQVERAQKRVPETKVAARGSKESIEASNWAHILLLVEEHNKLDPVTAPNIARIAQIQEELLPLASKVMEGKDHRELNGLKIDRAKGPGTEAFRFQKIDRARRMAQGVGPRPTVKVTERFVYAGGSAKDFPATPVPGIREYPKPPQA